MGAVSSGLPSCSTRDYETDAIRGATVILWETKTEAHVSDELICRNGRTPEEEFLHRVDNGIPLRDAPPTEEERRQSIHRILEEDSELLQMLADA